MDASSFLSGLVGALIGGGVALYTTRMQALSSREMQRDHNELEIRKNIYFKAYEAASAMYYSLHAYASKEAKDIEFDPELGAHLNRLHAVASIDIIKEVAKFQDYISDAILKISQVKLACDSIQATINHAYEMHEMYLKQHKEAVESFSTANTDEIIDQIQERCTELEGKMANCMKYVNVASPVSEEKQLELMEVTMAALADGVDKLKQFNISIRKELGFAFSKEDEKIYSDLIDASAKEARNKMANFSKFIKELAEENRKNFPDFT